MAKLIPGDIFGRLTVVSIENSTNVICRCSCGQEITVRSYNLRAGSTKSCGCIRKQQNNHTKHGGTGSLTHKRWRSMRARCLNPRASNYSQYGGAGVTICERWMAFENFLEDMGECPSPEMTLDRRDNAQGYTPENCRWATKTEQARNQSSNRMLTFQEETLNISTWAERLGIKQQTILNRLRYGWSVEETLSTHGDARAFRKPRRLER